MPHEEQTLTMPATDGRTIEELKAAEEFEELEVQKIEGTVVTTTEGTGFGLPGTALEEWKERTGREPGPGMKVRLYPRGLGTLHGVDLDGEEVYWRTPAERVADRAEWLASYDREQREEFAKEKEKLDRDYELLPDVLKARIDRYRAEDEGFRVTSEGYELFACVEAAKFYDRARAAVAHGNDTLDVANFWASDRGDKKVWSGEKPEEPEAAWLLWVWSLNSVEGGHARQKELLNPSPEHSGNTFDGAVMLALGMALGREL